MKSFNGPRAGSLLNDPRSLSMDPGCPFNDPGVRMHTSPRGYESLAFTEAKPTVGFKGYRPRASSTGKVSDKAASSLDPAT